MATNRLSVHPSVKGHIALASSRASWIGTLKIGPMAIPIKAFAAIASNQSTQLHQIHAGCGRRIAYGKNCPVHGAVAVDRIGKAYEYSSERLVELSDVDLAQLQPVDEKSITLERFFSHEHLDVTLLAGRSLYLVPANLAAQYDFSTLEAALQQKRVWALGRTVFSHKRQLVLVQARDNSVLLHTLHWPETRRAAVAVQQQQERVTRNDIRKLVKFIDTYTAPFDWTDYRDDSSERLASLVRSKVESKGKGSATKRSTQRKPKVLRKARPKATAKAA